jgi:bla regulator protein BlaR1
MDIGTNRLTGDSIPMAMFVGFLSGQVGRPVVNRTGLGGRYAIELRWTPDAASAQFSSTDAPPLADPSDGPIFTAIQEQLGLRLQSAHGPVDLIIIDQVARPSEN